MFIEFNLMDKNEHMPHSKDKVKEVEIHCQWKFTRIGTQLTTYEEEPLVQTLRNNLCLFTWTLTCMSDINLKVLPHLSPCY